MTYYGTCHFVSRSAAIKYFRPQEGRHAAAAVREKLAEGLIKIGRPKLKQGERLFTNREEGRYVIGVAA